jgi:hypothetical protein
VECHAQDGAPPRLDGGMDPEGEAGVFNRAYINLLAPRDASDSPSAGGLYVHPGRARTSPLIWHLFGRNTSRPWDGDLANGQSAKPIPAGKVPPLTNLETRTFVEWVDLGAMWDGVPGPDELSTGPPADGEKLR